MVSGVHRAAHVDYLAADIGRQIRSEEQGDLGDVVGRTSAPQWNLLGPLFLDLVRQRVGHVGDNEARGDRVGADSSRAELLGDRLGQTDQSGFRCRVVALSRKPC